MKINRLAHIPVFMAFVFILIYALPSGLFMAVTAYKSAIKEFEELEESSIEEYKQEMHQGVNSIISIIENRQAQTKDRVREFLVSHVDSAVAVMEGVYDNTRGKLDDEKVRSIVKAALRNIRYYDDQGYYFILSIDGIMELYPPDARLEGNGVLNIVDANEKKVIREILDIAKNTGEGFCEYVWPRMGSDEGVYQKIGYIRLFEPMGWIVGASIHIETVEEEIKREVLDIVNRFGGKESASVFIIDKNGEFLLIDDFVRTPDNKIHAMLSPYEQKAIDRVLKLGKQPDGGFTEFYWRSSGIQEPRQVLTYTKYFADWGWTVGVKADIESLRYYFFEGKINERINLRNRSIILLIVVFIYAFFIILIGYYFGKKIRHNLNAFAGFFEKAGDSYEYMDEKKLNLVEFKELSGYANRMVKDRIQKEETIKRVNEQLLSANQRLRNMAEMDGLTGLANRRRFDEAIQKEWKRAIRKAAWISLAMVDIDNFKMFNDTYGHQKGDECLKAVAQALQKSLNRPYDLAARYGGEEFVVLLPDTEMTGAQDVADKIQKEVESLNMEHKASSFGRVTFSMGIASIIPDNKITPGELVEWADKALYRAKSEGRNRIVLYRFETDEFE